MNAIPRKPSVKPGKTAQDFTALVDAVRRVHDECAAAVNRTVNTTLTLRNWLIGGYIHHYELYGADRAQYGERLMDRLANALRSHKIPATDRQRLYAYMSFYHLSADRTSRPAGIALVRYRQHDGDFPVSDWKNCFYRRRI